MRRFDNGRRPWPLVGRQRMIDGRCDRYEEEWRAGRDPTIADYLEGLEEPARTATWLELVMLDQELRRGRGETPALADYEESCPDRSVWLDVSTSDLPPAAVPGAGKAPEAGDITFAGRLDDLMAHAPGLIRAPARPGPPAAAVAPGEPADPAAPPSTKGPPLEGEATELDALVLARPGAVFGDYELIHRLGSGGMGVVFRARQTRLNREVALKMIKAGDLADKRHVRMFHAEAEAVAGLDHPLIVPVLDSGEHRGILYYSMKLIEGHDLGRCQGAYRDRPAAIAGLMARVAGAIAHAHERGILHRDLKPSNIMIDARGEPHVIDFGLARRIGATASSQSSMAGLTGGTPSYMAPEQARNDGAALTTATDVYGLGATLYVLLAGRPPFGGETHQQVMKRAAEEEPPRPRTRNPRVDPDLETICLKAMSREPKDRYPSARELADDLERWLSGRPILARPASPLERAVKWVRRRKLIAALSAAAAVGAILGVSGLAWGWMAAAAARDRALEGEDIARRHAYASTLNLAERDWRDASLAQVLRRLRETIPPPGQSDLRGFEWAYLDRLVRSQGLVLSGHTNVVRGISYSKDGRRLASGGDDRTVRIWDPAAGQAIRSTDAGTAVQAVALGPDGTRLASAGFDRAVTLRDAATGQVIRTSAGHTRTIFELEYSPDGKVLASSSEDGTVRLWDGADGSPKRTLADHPAGRYTRLAFSPDGKVLASAGGGDDTIRTWDVETGRLMRTIDDPVVLPAEAAGRRWTFGGDEKAVAYSPDGKALATGAEDGTIHFRDAGTGQLLRTLRDPHNRDAVTGLAFSRDGRRLASSTFDGQAVGVWDVATGDLVRTLKVHALEIREIAFAPDGANLACACDDGKIRILDATRDQESRTLPEGHVPHDVAFGPDGTFLAAAMGDGTVTIRELPGGVLVRTLRGHVGPVRGVAISPDGRRLASTGDDQTVRIWEVATGAAIHTLRGHVGPIPALAFSADAKALATASYDRTIKLWDPAAGRELRTLKGHAFEPGAVAFAPDGKTLASGDMDGFLMIWDAESGRRIRAVMTPGESILSIAYSPDGRRLATGLTDGTIRIRDVETGEEVRTLAGHATKVSALAFSPDGKRLVSSGADRTVRIWDPASGLGVLVLRGHSGMVESVAISPDGARIASAGTDQTVRIWEAGRLPGARGPSRP